MSLFRTKPTTVDAALAPLLQAISDLETVNSDRISAATSKETEAKRLQDEATADRNEAQRAISVLAKLRTLTEAE